MIGTRWHALDGEALLPLLPKMAQRYKDFPELRETHAYAANQLSADALLRWWQLDPAGACPAIIHEILRPKPRLGAALLGVLPDETLPEVEMQLADRLTSSGNNYKEQIASLISRYATQAIQSQVEDYLDPKIDKEAWAVQTSLLAYLLRVDPVAAQIRLERAMTARGPESSDCNHVLLTDVAALRNDPSLERLAIQSMSDGDPEVAANAAAYLAAYGRKR